MKTTTKAFTLIELLVVVSIISLLSTVVLYQTGDARSKADDVHMKQEVQQVKNAIALYREDSGVVPVSVSYAPETDGMVYEDSDAYQESMGLLVPDYLPEVPRSPDGTSYSYLATADGSNAVFAANLNKPSSSSGTNSCSLLQENFEPECRDLIQTTYYHDIIGYCIYPVPNRQITEVVERDRWCTTSINEQLVCQDQDGYYIPPANNCSNPPPQPFSYSYYLETCEIEEVENAENPICSGSSNTDYCSCI